MATTKPWGKSDLCKSSDDGVSVYSHLTEVLATMLETKPADPYSALEAISTKVKASYLTASGLSLAKLPPTSVTDAASSDAWQSASDKLLKAPSADAEEEELPEGEPVPDLLNEMQMLEWAGFGLSREDSMRVYTSLVKLQISAKLAKVRFFGKVLGTEADYYVAEATYVEPPEPPEEEGAPPPPVPVEKAGEGCNACVYFVTNDPGSAWTALPDVTPAQVSAARHIRKYLTGSLEAAVRCFPPFPGAEKNYLRAQIAHIVHATVLCPKDKFLLEGEEEPKTVALNPLGEEDPKLPTGPDMKSLANWCTYYMGILGIGRTTNPPKEEEEEEEEGEAKPKGPEPEPEVPALSPVPSSEWAVQAIPRMGGAPVMVARSSRWPGAVAAAVMKEDKFVNMYIGFGHEALGSPFVPMAPPAIELEPDELPEQTDPTIAEEKKLAEEKAAAAASAEEEGEGY